MPKGDYYFPVYYQKLLTSTQGWKDEEFGAYVRLLICQYDKGAIPEDFKTLCRIAPTAKKNWSLLSQKFTNKNSLGLINPVMDQIRNKRIKKSETATGNGKLGGRPKNQKVTETKPNGFKIETNNNMVNGYSNSSSSFEGLQGNFSPDSIIGLMQQEWMGKVKDYPFSATADLSALFEIGEFLSGPLKMKWLPETDVGYAAFKTAWKELSDWIVQDNFYKSLSLTSIAKTSTLQTIWQKSKQQKNGTHQQSLTGGSSRNKRNNGAYQLLESLKDDLAGPDAAGI